MELIDFIKELKEDSEFSINDTSENLYRKSKYDKGYKNVSIRLIKDYKKIVKWLINKMQKNVNMQDIIHQLELQYGEKMIAKDIDFLRAMRLEIKDGRTLEEKDAISYDNILHKGVIMHGITIEEYLNKRPNLSRSKLYKSLDTFCFMAQRCTFNGKNEITPKPDEDLLELLKIIDGRDNKEQTNIRNIGAKTGKIKRDLKNNECQIGQIDALSVLNSQGKENEILKTFILTRMKAQGEIFFIGKYDKSKLEKTRGNLDEKVNSMRDKITELRVQKRKMQEQKIESQGDAR